MTPTEELEVLLLDLADADERIAEQKAARAQLCERIKALLPVENETLTEVARAIVDRSNELGLLTGLVARGDDTDDARLDRAALWLSFTDRDLRALRRKEPYAAYVQALKKADELTGVSLLRLDPGTPRRLRQETR